MIQKPQFKLKNITLKDSEVLRITYVLTTHCPYACRYCPDSLHTGKHTNIDLQKLGIFLDRFSHRKLEFNITGGESTTHPQIIELLELVKSKSIPVCLDSNLVRTARFYDSIKHLVDNWLFTLHPSQSQLDVEKIKTVTDHAFVVVYVSMDPLHWDRSLSWYHALAQVPDIKIVPIKLIDNWGGSKHSLEYDQAQLDQLQSLPNITTFTKDRETLLRRTHTWLQNYESNIDPYQLIKQGQNRFKNWKCLAGNHNIMIYDNETTFWACGIKTYDSFLDVHPDQLQEPLTCTRETCDCATDIRATKWLDQ